MAALAPTPSSLRLSPINKAHNFSIHLPSRSMVSLRIAPTTRISPTFQRLKEQGKVAFIPHITTGDPDMSTTLKALKILDSCGSDIIELGVPYSDPLADGPVIQAAATRALSKGANFNAIVAMLKETIPQISSPIALFSYYNPILKRGVEKFMSIIEDVGVHGLVVPDVPLEETEILRKVAAKHHIELVLLATPTAPTERMKAIVEASVGFVYLIHTPVMCYSNFNDIIDMDAGVITIENSCSGKKILCEEVKYSAGIGQRVYDIHSPWIPSTEEIAGRINKILAVLEINILWVNPDCGLETRKFGEVNPALTNMVPAA